MYVWLKCCVQLKWFRTKNHLSGTETIETAKPKPKWKKKWQLVHLDSTLDCHGYCLMPRFTRLWLPVHYFTIKSMTWMASIHFSRIDRLIPRKFTLSWIMLYIDSFFCKSSNDWAQLKFLIRSFHNYFEMLAFLTWI